jgi:type II secretory pathway pseudopilin PulG
MTRKMPQQQKLRDASGTTLVEMMISVVCTSLITMAMFSVIWMNTIIQAKSGNNLDAANAARIAIDRIGRDAREARSLGDVYGEDIVLSSAPPMTGTSGTDYFPSANDPIYAGGATPAGGVWPTTWPTDACPNPGRYLLSNRCLIIQVPVYDSNGWPTQIPVSNPYVAGLPTPMQGNQANVETHIYRVLDDPANPGQYLLQLFVAPGRAAPGYVPAEHTFGPQTLVKGIVGPKNAQNEPAIFQFIARRGSLDDTNPSGQPQDSIPEASPGVKRLANFTGIIVNLEVTRSDYGRSKPVTLAFKQEVFIRNNAMSTSVGNPPPAP